LVAALIRQDLRTQKERNVVLNGRTRITILYRTS